MGIFEDSLKAMGRRIGRSKKIVDGSFPGGVTGHDTGYVSSARSKMPDALRDVDTSYRLRSERQPSRVLHQEYGSGVLDESIATDPATEWARKTGRVPMADAGPKGLLSEEERAALFEELPLASKRAHGNVAEEWLRSRDEIVDYGGRQNSLRYPQQYDTPTSGSDLEQRLLPLATGQKINRKAERVGRSVESHTEPLDFRSTAKSGGTTGVWEEPPQLRSRVDVSDSQWQRYLQRINDRTPVRSEERMVPGVGKTQVPVGAGSEAAMQAMGGDVAPSGAESLFSRIKTPNPEKDQRFGGRLVKGYDTQDLPKEEAYQKLLKDNPAMGGKGELLPHDQAIPQARVLSNRGGSPSYEERKYQSVGPAVQQAVESLKAARPAMKNVAPLSGLELAKKTTALEDLWVSIGKGGSVEGRMWNKLRQSSTAGGRHKVATTKDYFFRVGFKWMMNKEKTAEKYPREVKMLEDAWSTRHGQ